MPYYLPAENSSYSPEVRVYAYELYITSTHPKLNAPKAPHPTMEDFELADPILATQFLRIAHHRLKPKRRDVPDAEKYRLMHEMDLAAEEEQERRWKEQEAQRKLDNKASAKRDSLRVKGPLARLILQGLPREEIKGKLMTALSDWDSLRRMGFRCDMEFSERYIDRKLNFYYEKREDEDWKEMLREYASLGYEEVVEREGERCDYWDRGEVEYDGEGFTDDECETEDDSDYDDEDQETEEEDWVQNQSEMTRNVVSDENGPSPAIQAKVPSRRQSAPGRIENVLERCGRVVGMDIFNEEVEAEEEEEIYIPDVRNYDNFDNSGYPCHVMIKEIVDDEEEDGETSSFV